MQFCQIISFLSSFAVYCSNFTNLVYPLSSNKAYQDSGPIYSYETCRYIYCHMWLLYTSISVTQLYGSYRYLYKRLSSFLNLCIYAREEFPFTAALLVRRKISNLLIYIHKFNNILLCIIYIHKTLHSTHSY